VCKNGHLAPSFESWEQSYPKCQSSRCAIRLDFSDVAKMADALLSTLRNSKCAAGERSAVNHSAVAKLFNWTWPMCASTHGACTMMVPSLPAGELYVALDLVSIKGEFHLTYWVRDKTVTILCVELLPSELTLVISLSNNNNFIHIIYATVVENGGLLKRLSVSFSLLSFIWIYLIRIIKINDDRAIIIYTHIAIKTESFHKSTV